MKPFLIAVLLAFFALPLQALPQITSTDSLREQLNKSQADTNRVKLLLELSYSFVKQPRKSTSDFNNAVLLAQQATTLSQSLGYYYGEAKSYLITAKIMREKGELPLGKTYTQRALALAKKYNFLSLVGYAYSELTRYYSNTAADVATKVHLNEQALSFFVRAGEKKKEAELWKELGDLHQLQENYHQSLKDLQRALRLYRAVNHPDLQQVYDLLGFVSTKTGDYKAGLSYGLKAVRAANLRGDSSLLLCTIYNRLGLTYYSLRQYGQAHNYFKKSLAIAQKYNHPPSIVYLSGNISSIYLSAGKPRQALSFLREISGKYPLTDYESRIILAIRFMDVYRSLKQYSRAQFYCDLALELAEKNGAGSPGMAATYQSVVQFMIASSQYETARKYLGLNQVLCRKQGSAGALASNHLQWFRLDSTLNSFPSAIVHYQRYVALRDSLLTESKNHQIAQLEIQYQTEKKDQALKLKEKNIQLLTERGRLQQQKLEKSQMIRNATFAGTFMLLLLLGLGYTRYQLQQKSNLMLEAKQFEINEKNHSLEQVLREKDLLLKEKEWMLKEIHHRVRNNLQIITSLLNSQASYLSDNVALSTIKESQHRVQAMALIHQKLYQSEQVARVEMASYITDLVVYLRDSYEHLLPVRFNLLVEPLNLDVTLAVPLGLIINEAVTNSLKYAFPPDYSGTITLGLQRMENSAYQLTIMDDGVGLPPGFQPSRSRSLGMTLLHGLSKQLDGDLKITDSPGVTISLEFHDEPLGSTYNEADRTYRWHKPFTTLIPIQLDERTYWKI